MKFTRTRCGIVGLTAMAFVAVNVMTGHMASGAAPARVQPRVATPPATTYAIIKSVSVGQGAAGVTVNSGDDTVYVTTVGAGNYNLSVIEGATGTRRQIIPMGFPPNDVAVDQSDDTVYVTLSNNPSAGRLAVLKASNLDDSRTTAVGVQPEGVAVNDADDTVYVANANTPANSQGTLSAINGRNVDDSRVVNIGLTSIGVDVDQVDDTVYVSNSYSNSVSILKGRALDDSSTVGAGSKPYGVAVNQADDTVYAANYNGYNVSVINGRTGTRTDDTVTLGARYAYGLAVDQADDTVYVTEEQSGVFYVVNGRTNTLTDDSMTIGFGLTDLAVDQAGTNAGLIYVGRYGVAQAQALLTIGRVTPSAPSSGVSNDTFAMEVSVPNLSPSFAMDDSTVTSVSFGGASAAVAPAAGNYWTVTIPAGATGSTVPVTVTFKGGLVASAGNFTYTAPTPPPTPVYPPGAPTDVKALPGDGSATVSWTAPSYTGSYPITNYRVISQPGALSCLVAAPETSCTVSGLTNGTEYTFTVEALNGAGWGTPSAPSNPVTPSAPAVVRIVLDQGTRVADGVHDRIITSGTTVGIPTGQKLTPHIRYAGQTAFSDGVATIIVRADGTFSWTRKIRKDRGLTAYVSWQSTDSNRVYWARVR